MFSLSQILLSSTELCRLIHLRVVVIDAFCALLRGARRTCHFLRQNRLVELDPRQILV